jgi:hypothetical protein
LLKFDDNGWAKRARLSSESISAQKKPQKLFKICSSAYLSHFDSGPKAERRPAAMRPQKHIEVRSSSFQIEGILYV